MAKQSIYPFPVFEGHFDDGSVLRLSFYSPAGKPIDQAAGARLVTAVATASMRGKRLYVKRGPGDVAKALVVPEGQYGAWVKVDGRWRKPAVSNGRKLVSGFVEHPSIGRVGYAPGMVTKKAPKATRGALVTALGELVRIVEQARGSDCTAVLQARFLLAHETAA